MTPTKQARAVDRIAWASGSPRRRRPGHTPRPWVADLLLVLAGLGLGITLALVATAESRGSLAAPGGLLLVGGRLAGFVGTYLILVMVVLIARLPWLERAVGQDRLVAWHRRLGPWALWLITAHVVLITLGYARMSHTGFLRQLWVFLSSYPDLLAAMVGFGLLVMAGITSIRIARRRMHYETWWVVHLYFYLALALAFAHQVVTGVAFIGHPLARAFWIVVWAATAGMVLVFRVLLPVVRNVRHQLKVVAVSEEAPGVYSLTCTGRNLSDLAVSGGQFFQWRFLATGLWWHAHPYSLSALPQAPYLRVTVKGLGDQSRAVAHLRPGTRVFVEGPYGAFTHHVRATNRVVLIGAGVGITPLRALLEDLPRGVEATVIIRASSAEEIVHRHEVVELVAARGGRLFEVLGPRHAAQLDVRTLRDMVPDLDVSDVYVCGPEGFNETVIASCVHAGVPGDRIHVEVFSF
jgi:predicted ferric reductase